MNWYKIAKEHVAVTSAPIIGLEEKILRVDAERVVRRRLFAKGQYAPEEKAVAAYVNRVMKKIKEEYSSFNQIRPNVNGETLMPVVNEIVSKIIK